VAIDKEKKKAADTGIALVHEAVKILQASSEISRE